MTFAVTRDHARREGEEGEGDSDCLARSHAVSLSRPLTVTARPSVSAPLQSSPAPRSLPPPVTVPVCAPVRHIHSAPTPSLSHMLPYPPPYPWVTSLAQHCSGRRQPDRGPRLPAWVESDSEGGGGVAAALSWHRVSAAPTGDRSGQRSAQRSAPQVSSGQLRSAQRSAQRPQPVLTAAVAEYFCLTAFTSS